MTWTRGDAPLDVPADRFVGRSQARTALANWASQAWSGRLRLITVTGDPGIGKSALVDQVVAQWALEGATVLTATCHEDLSVPYLPILTALRAVTPRDDVGNPSIPARPDQIPGLFVTLADELIARATTTRVVLRVDDLHWVDPATTELLGHILATAASYALTQPLTLLVVITSRSLEPRSSAGRLVERLRLEPAFREIDIGPLDELEVNQLLERILARRVSRRLLEDVLDSTEGNPLRVRAAIEHLERIGALEIHNGEVTANGDVGTTASGFNDVVLARLDALSGAERDLLLLAALMGNDLDPEDLRHVAGLDEATMDAALDSLEMAQFLFERPDGTLRFSESLVRSLLARSRSVRARRELHLHIAQRIAERVDGPDDVRVLEVAHHLRRAGPRAPSDQVLHYSRLALDQSIAMGAWAKAALYAELALGASDVDTESTRDVVGLHLAAAEAHFRNHDSPPTLRHCDAVVALARRSGDHDSWGRALILGARTRVTLTNVIGADLDEFRDLVEFIQIGFVDGAFTCSPEVEARSWQLLAEISMAAGDLDRAASAARTASEVAVASGDDVLIAEAEFAAGLGRFGALEPAEAIAHFDRSIAAARAGGDEWIVAWGMSRRVISTLLAGDVTRSISDAETTIEHCRRTHHWAEHGLVTAGAAAGWLATGDLVGAERTARAAIASHGRSSFPYIPALAWPVMAYAQALRLDRESARQTLAEWAASGVRGAARFGLLVDALTLPRAQFEGSIDFDRYVPASRAPTHVFSAGGLAIDVEVGSRSANRGLLEQALVRLDTLHSRDVVLLLPMAASVGRLRAMAMAGLGDTTGEPISLLLATSHALRQGGAVVEAFRCDVERCILAAAVDPEAIGLEAESLAAELARRSLLCLRSRLSESLPDVMRGQARLDRTVVVWDMVESTPMLIRQGDLGYIDLIHEVNELIERRLTEHHGIAFKYTGDGMYAWFLHSADALRCARAVREDLRARNVRSGVPPVVLRTGIAVGQPVDDEGDLFGMTVVVACRLCDRAVDDQILCTVEAADSAGSSVATTFVGELQLKGVGAATACVELG